MEWIKQNCNYKFDFSYVDLRKICEKVWRNFMCFSCHDERAERYKRCKDKEHYEGTVVSLC